MGNHELLTQIVLNASDDIKCFSSDAKSIHSFFYHMSTKKGYSVIFQNFLFDTNGDYPYCEEIDKIVQALQISGIIESNPIPIDRTYRIGVDNKNKMFEEYFSNNELKLIQGTSKEFCNALGCT